MKLRMNGWWALPVVLLLGAGSAGAVQFTPASDARLHTLASGQPGATWNTGGLGFNGNATFTASTGQLVLDAQFDVLNYFQPSNGACATDAGSNCAFNFGPDLVLDVLATLDSVTATAVGGGFFQIDLNFASTGGTDVTLLDPTDNTILLTASWQSGTFLGTPTTGLTVSNFFDSNTGMAVGTPSVVGFAAADAGGLYNGLLDSGGVSNIMLNLSQFFDHSPTLDQIAQAILATGSVPDFTAEGQGSVFRVASGEFVVPEPSTLAMLGLASAGLAFAGRRRLG